MDCLFCKIASKEIPAEIIYEDDNAIAFLDINPLTPGHTIVIPKTHAENIIDLGENETSSLFLAVKKVTSLLQEKLSPKGFTIGINHGEISGQTVPHLHIHIIPRYEGDNGGSIHSVVKLTVSETISETKKKITG